MGSDMNVDSEEMIGLHMLPFNTSIVNFVANRCEFLSIEHATFPGSRICLYASDNDSV
jgi:hypothetical protein